MATILEACERETVITTSDMDTEWVLFTSQKPMMTHMKNIEIEPYKVDRDVETNEVIGAYYKIPLKQVLVRKERKKVEYSEERREALKEHMRKVHAIRMEKLEEKEEKED